MGAHHGVPPEAAARFEVTPQRVLLVGGSGFMGRYVAEALTAAGHTVAVLARGERQPPPGVELLRGARDDAASLGRALEGRRFDLTVDFLAFDAVDVERLLLLPYAALGRYVMISSGQVYLVARGATAPYPEEETEREAIAEPPAGTRDHLQWSYGIGKRRAEQVLLGLRGSHGVRAVALRLPIVQGNGDGSLRLWAWLERMLDGGPVLVPDGARLSRHVWAGDVARAVLWLADHDAPRHTFYNLAQPELVTLRELLERIAHAAGLTPTFVDVTYEEMEAAGIDGDAVPWAGRWASVPDPTRLITEWRLPTTPLGEYLPGVVQWHLEHRPTGSHVGYAYRDAERAFAHGRGATTSQG
jgi:nucleoside-diphosphate-sugar epimerase